MENYTKQFIWLYFHHAESPGYLQELLIHDVPFLQMMRKRNQQQQHETKKLVD